MNVQLYAVTEAVPEGVGAELRCVSDGSLSAVVGEALGQPSREMLWRYEHWRYPAFGWTGADMTREGSIGLLSANIQHVQ